jgi:two-component system nitrogen regulation sensor histidine kinase NtrY
MATRGKKRWVGLVLLVLGLPWAIYYLLSRLAEPELSPEAGQWLLPALSLALVVLTLGLAGVLIRNLVKLIVERRRGILGAKLRSKLVFFLLAFVLLPAIVLFSGSAHVIKQTVEAILRTPAEHLRHGDDIVAEWREHFRAQSRLRVAALSEEIVLEGLLDPDRRGELASLLERRLRAEGHGMLRVVTAGRRVAGAERLLEPAQREDMERLVDTLIADAARAGRPVDRFDRLRGGLLAHAAVPVEDPGSPEGATVVAVALVLPSGIAESLASIDSAVASYQQFRHKRRDLVRLYVTLIGLIFIATLFVATWIGWYVARRITEPIQQVAAASREISAGNMDVRVRARVGDEMAMLVDAFNEMAAELQENREVITRSTAELRRSNQALEERRRYIETLVANLSTAVISLEPAGRVTTTNPAVEKILGIRLRSGQAAEPVLREGGLEPLADLLRQAVGSAGEGIRRDLELPETSPTRHVSVQITPLKGRSHEQLGSLIMVEDLSDLLRAQKAVAWQEVARRIAHEIKNPLTPIQLAAQRLRKKFFAKADDLDEVLLEATASIEREVGGLKHLVDEFSRFARMPQIEPKPVEFVQVVESVLSLYKGLPEIDWQVDLDPRVGRVRLDAQQMRRALINLIDNAVAAISERGTIRVSTRLVGGNGSVRLEIADSGPGIPSADRDKMFAPYFSTKKRGTGLGLAIVHKVVTDHRGTIRVEDNAPHGARFVIDLPG